MASGPSARNPAPLVLICTKRRSAMPRSSETIGAIAGALAKAQIELANPEKPLTATIHSPFPREGGGSFRYPSLSTGFDLVRKSLGRHEIATVQTTSIDDSAGLIRLTTTLAHSSGEWVASDWPVCPVSETAAPHRMGAALTYARRYALFTLVGIAGEDDLDAPDLNGGLPSTLPIASSSDPSNQPAAVGFDDRAREPHSGSAQPAPRKAIKRHVILDPENSGLLTQQLIAELAALTDAEALTAWAGETLPRKNQLVTSDAEALENAFAAKLSEFGGDVPGSTKDQISGKRADEGLKNARDRSRGANDNPAPTVSHETPRCSVSPIGKTLRLRDRDHLKFVTQQPCLACGRSPSDAHHLKFAQGRALARKVSDEYTVPLCRSHHRELHRRGDERSWWQQLNIDPLLSASTLWARPPPALAQPAWATNGVSTAYETKPISAAITHDKL